MSRDVPFQHPKLISSKSFEVYRPSKPCPLLTMYNCNMLQVSLEVLQPTNTAINDQPIFFHVLPPTPCSKDIVKSPYNFEFSKICFHNHDRKEK
jgi:hypothetical protein